jgi:xanthine dehydrogenase YagT iron-sulfur-binding subunit
MNDTTHDDDGHKHDASPGWPGFTRRAFMQSFGAGTLTLAVSRSALAEGESPEEPLAAGEALRITLDVNGRSHQVLVEPRWTLLHVLREKLGLTAAKSGCERGECGACTVLIDNIARYACLTLAVEAEGQRIETVEGLMDGEHLGQVQESFVSEDGLQCGYCTPGQIMAAEGLLRRNPNPSFEEIRAGMSGNLCRCGAYAHIFNAVADAARHRKG